APGFSHGVTYGVSFPRDNSVCHRSHKPAASAGGLQESSRSRGASAGPCQPLPARSHPAQRILGLHRVASKRPRVDRTRPADLRRVIRRELIAEGLAVWTVPDGRGTALSHAAELDPVGSSDHATGHCKALVADVMTLELDGKLGAPPLELAIVRVLPQCLFVDQEDPFATSILPGSFVPRPALPIPCAPGVVPVQRSGSAPVKIDDSSSR